MTDPRREADQGTLTPADGPQKADAGRHGRSKTEGTDRDFDETGRSANQGHGHPREERDRGADPERG